MTKLIYRIASASYAFGANATGKEKRVRRAAGLAGVVQKSSHSYNNIPLVNLRGSGEPFDRLLCSSANVYSDIPLCV